MIRLMILQKRNSGELKCWGCSAFEVVAPVAIERPATVRRAHRPCSIQASAKSAILHSCIMIQESRECCHNAQLCKHSFGKGFCSVPFLATLFNEILFQLLNILKSVVGNYQRAKARGWKGGKMEVQTLPENHQKIKFKKSFLAKNSVFIGLNRNMKSSVLFFDNHTIHFYEIMITV